MKKAMQGVDVLLVVLATVCLLLGVALAAVMPILLVPVALLLLLLALGIWFNLRRVRRVIASVLRGGNNEHTAQYSLMSLPVPVMILSGKSMIWYNDTFRQQVLHGEDQCLLSVGRLFPGLELQKCAGPTGQDVEREGVRYTVYGSPGEADGKLFVAYLIENTELKRQAAEYTASRPAYMIIELDTYDEILRELRESERARIVGEVNRLLESYIGRTTGFLARVSTSRYIAVVEERHIKDMVAARFDLLDKARQIGGEHAAVTLSIGVGRGGKTLVECQKMAAQALDMALGRGGDQAAVRTADGFAFYGGVSQSVEKRSKVKSRIVAAALTDLIHQSDSVLIMGHRASDLDAVGAAIGVLRICRICKKPAAIVIKKKESLAENLVDEMIDAGYGDDFMLPEEVLDSITPKTLLVIVDTHLPYLLESREVYQACKNVVLIDHHRKCVGYIENAVISYHEPYASSTCELVSELLQYVDGDDRDRLTPLEAQALLAGITLDTRTFALHTGVRTFEAAAYLRRMGAQTQKVKKLFSSSFAAYEWKSRLVTEAKLYHGCAVVVTSGLPSEMAVVVPQAANDLLTIDGVQASVVAVEMNGQVNISARSLGEVNVQVILEKLGGGGHLTMAGAQLKNTTVAQARQMILAAIEEYRKNENRERSRSQR